MGDESGGDALPGAGRGRWQRPLFWLGVAVLVAAQALTAAGMALRGYITGLVPLTGMFETVVFVALYCGPVGALVCAAADGDGFNAVVRPTATEHCSEDSSP